MWKKAYLAGAALCAILAAGQAQAADPIVIYAPTSDISVNVMAHQGPHVAGSNVNNTNGTQTYLNIGSGGSASSAGALAGVSGDAYIPGNSGDKPITATAHGSASLAEGTMKASVLTTGPDNFGTPGGDVSAKIADTLYFTNTTGGDLALGLTFTFEGGVVTQTPLSPSSSGYGSLLVAGCGSCGNLRFAADGAGVGDQVSAFWNDLDGVYNIASWGGLIPVFGDSGHWHTESFGEIGALISTTILIPAGESTLGLQALLNVSCRSGDSCDFGHTAKFGFGPLPTGLSYTSASGLFLSSVAGPIDPGGGGGGVPEPATWAMMILGFGLAGAAIRSRRFATAA